MTSVFGSLPRKNPTLPGTVVAFGPRQLRGGGGIAVLPLQRVGQRHREERAVCVPGRRAAIDDQRVRVPAAQESNPAWHGGGLWPKATARRWRDRCPAAAAGRSAAP